MNSLLSSYISNFSFKSPGNTTWQQKNRINVHQALQLTIFHINVHPSLPKTNSMEKFINYNKDRVLVTDLSCKAVGCNFQGSASQQLLTHYSKVHRSNSVINSPCLFSAACPSKNTFKTFFSLDSHLRRMHPSFFEKNESYDQLTGDVPSTSDNTGMQINTVVNQTNCTLLQKLIAMRFRSRPGNKYKF